MKSALLFLSFTKNNTIFSLTDFKGNVLHSTSLGSQSRKNVKKLNPSFSNLVVSYFVKQITKLGYSAIHLKLSGSNKTKRTTTRIFKRSGLQIFTVQDITSNPHNGCRLSKKRRL
uniref:Ribosomal protein S11 n=1 Tax=Hildenbrandia rubra TaxID=31481 RepID=A0A0A7A7A7_9FLOR|nr:ribosomal protein S11 [Hildenbrandia rubra]AHB62132.1 ribosomal protein S11 [Hildenbrandia rubra]